MGLSIRNIMEGSGMFLAYEALIDTRGDVDAELFIDRAEIYEGSIE